MRCAQERGFQPPEVLTPPGTPLALPAREEGSTDSEEEEALMQLEAAAEQPKEKDGSDIELEPAETTRHAPFLGV